MQIINCLQWSNFLFVCDDCHLLFCIYIVPLFIWRVFFFNDPSFLSPNAYQLHHEHFAWACILSNPLVTWARQYMPVLYRIHIITSHTLQHTTNQPQILLSSFLSKKQKVLVWSRQVIRLKAVSNCDATSIPHSVKLNIIIKSTIIVISDVVSPKIGLLSCKATFCLSNFLQIMSPS